MTAQLTRRQLFRLGSLAIGSTALGMALSSCKPESTPTPPPAKAEEQPAAPKTTEAPKAAPAKKTVVHWPRNPTEQEVVWKELVPIAAEMAPDIEIEFAAPAEELEKNLIIAFAGGTAPDSVVVGLSAFRGWYGLGITRSLQPHLDQDNTVQALLPEYVPAAVEGYSYKGELYCVPTVSESIELWYNKTAILEAGLTPPAEIEDDPEKWNWDTMREYAQKVNKGEGFRRERFGAMVTSRQSDNSVTEAWGNFVTGAGGRLWDQDGEEFLMNSPETLQALEWIVGLIKEYDVHPDVGEMGSADIRDRALFQNGQLGMVVQGEYFRRYLWGSGMPSEGIPFDYDMCLVPANPVTKKTANLYHGNGTCMTNQVKDADATWEWLSVVFSQDAQQVFSDLWGSRGAHSGTHAKFIAENAGGGPDGLNYGVFGKADAGTIPYYLPIYAPKPAVCEPWKRILFDNVFQGKMSVPEGLAQIETETKAVFDKAKAEWEAKK